MVDRVTRTLPIGLEADQPGLDQDLQMLRNGRLREIEMVDHLTARAAAAGRKMLQDLDARRMRKRGQAERNGAAFRAAGFGGFGHRPSAIDDEEWQGKLGGWVDWSELPISPLVGEIG